MDHLKLLEEFTLEDETYRPDLKFRLETVIIFALLTGILV